jgi:membrane fusion protein, heavy metal efflux system
MALKKQHWIGIGVIVFVAIIAVFVFKKKPDVATDAGAATDVPKLVGNSIRFSSEFASRSNLHPVDVKEKELSPTIEVTGSVDFDPRHVALVGVRIGGRVRGLFKYEGDTVAAGEALAEIESAELGQAQAEVTKQKARLNAALAHEQRESSLAEARVTSQRDSELAKMEAVATRAELAAAEQTLHAMGGDTSGTEAGIMRLRTPIAGEVVSPSLHRGAVVDASTLLFRIANLEHLWVEFTVFEQELPAIRVGDKAQIIASPGGSEPLTGKIDHVGRVLEESSRSARVRVVVDNTNGRLRPGQSVRGHILASGPKATWSVVPLESVIRIDGKSTVFVWQDDNSVEIRPVKVGPRDHESAAIIEGVGPNERVAGGSVFALKSEIFR